MDRPERICRWSFSPFLSKNDSFFHFFPFFRSCLALDLVGKDDPTKHFFRHLFWGKGFLIDPCPLGTPSHCRNFVGCFLFTLAHLTSQLCRFIWKPQFCFSSLIVGIIVYTFNVPNHQSWQMLCLCFRVPALWLLLLLPPGRWRCWRCAGFIAKIQDCLWWTFGNTAILHCALVGFFYSPLFGLCRLCHVFLVRMTEINCWNTDIVISWFFKRSIICLLCLLKFISNLKARFQDMASKQEVWAEAQGSQRVKLPKSAMFSAKGFKTRFPRKLSRSSGVATMHPNNLSLGMFLVIPQHHQHGPFSHPKTRRRGHEDHLSPSGAVNVVANGASRRKQRPSLPDVMQLSCDQVTKVKSYSIGALWWDGIWE